MSTDAESISRMIANVCWALACECTNDDVIVVGVATPMAAAAAFLARELFAPGLTILVGGAVNPALTDVAALATDPHAASRSAEITLGQRELLPLLQRGSITLQFVSPAQVDRTGAVNTSRVRTTSGIWRRLPGCLALPDTTAMVGRLVAYRVEGTDRFVVGQVDHVSGMGRDIHERDRLSLSGRGVVAVITEAGRCEIEQDGLGPMSALEPAPKEADELLRQAIDPHGILGLESRSGRLVAQQSLAAYTAGAR